MKINIRNLDLVKKILEVVNKELLSEPRYYTKLINELRVVMEEFKDE